MLHHRLGLHEGRRYWLGGLPHIPDGQAKCHLPRDPKHLQNPLPMPGWTLQGIPTWARPGVTTVSFPTAMHCAPPFRYTSALLQPSQAFYVPAAVLPIPSAAAPAGRLQHDHPPNTISTWSAKLPDKAHTTGTFPCLLCRGGRRPDSLSQCLPLWQASNAAETLLLHVLPVLTCSAPS